MVTCQVSTRYWNYLEVYWPCAGGLSAVNAIGTQLRDPINSELGNPVSKHQIQPEYGDEQASAGRDCRTRLARPNCQARTRTRKYNIHFSCSADHVQDWQPSPVDPYSCSCYMCDHTSPLHAVSHRQPVKKAMQALASVSPLKRKTPLPRGRSSLVLSSHSEYRGDCVSTSPVALKDFSKISFSAVDVPSEGFPRRLVGRECSGVDGPCSALEWTASPWVLPAALVTNDELASDFLFDNFMKPVRATGEVDTQPPRYSEWEERTRLDRPHGSGVLLAL